MVIPGRAESADPESRDKFKAHVGSGFRVVSLRSAPGMTKWPYGPP